MGVVVLGMGSDLALGTAGIEDAILRDVEMVADGTEASCLVTGFEGFYWEVLGHSCGRTVNDD